MVICFTKYLLDQKHQLSRIWLAAHWEKKIKRAQVFEVDIESSVQDIMETEIILDLRISGHLLVGIVKIHAKKSKYLLSECNSIFHQVKVFHSGSINLPENKQRALVDDLTLTEFFDNLIVENDKIETILTANQSHVEEITLKEINDKLTLWDDNDIVDFTVNEEETFENFEESLLSLEGSLEIAKDLNLVVGKNKIVVNKQPKIKRSKKIAPEENQQAFDICSDAGIFDVNVTDPETAINVIPETQCIPNGDIHNFQLGEFDESSNSMETDKLSLEPLKFPSNNFSKERKSKKRKLCVDCEKCLSLKVIKKNMMHTSDTMAAFDLAPATKRLMDLKQTGYAQSLLSLPFLKQQNPRLLKLYQRHLNTKLSDNFELLSEEESLQCEDMRRKKSKSDPQENWTLVENPPKDFEAMDASANRNNTDLNVENDIPPLDDNFIHTESRIMIDDPVFENEACNHLPVEDPPIIQKSNISNTQSTPKTSQEKWEYAFQDRMVQMLKYLKLLFQERSVIRFSFLVQNNRKLLVSQKFLCLLMLKKFEVICLEQASSFDEVFITPDLNFDSALSKFCT